MIGRDPAGRRWSIGQLAQASGVTVRTLYHYDDIGLVRPSERTASGHRRYTEDDLRRLYRVRALRALGMSLEQIGGVITESATDLVTLRRLLRAQLADLRTQAGRIERLTEQVHGLLRRLDQSSMPDPDEFVTTLEMISVLDGHFTQEQQERLARRRAELGHETVESARTRWAGLVAELLPHVRIGTPVDDPRVQELVRRWDELGAAFHAGDGDTEEAARRMWRDHRTELSRRLPWPADQLADLTGYLERARTARSHGPQN
ncbi:MerR family transcriptional regulator [Marinactinospora rubrisoli]|uniref:MerR family transcriptional regulator n=1 Tax=Marinactinospora rubrisoli TaxID=2715399 RepID=A0ABW2KH73_9ACTN